MENGKYGTIWLPHNGKWKIKKLRNTGNTRSRTETSVTHCNTLFEFERFGVEKIDILLILLRLIE